MKMWEYNPFLLRRDGIRIGFNSDICLRDHGIRYDLFVIGHLACQINCESSVGFISFMYHRDSILSIRTVTVDGLGLIPDCRNLLIDIVLQNRDAVSHLGGGESRVHRELSRKL